MTPDEARRWMLYERLHVGRADEAAAALVALRREGAAALPYAIAASRDPARRIAAVVLLGDLGDPGGLQALRAIAADADPTVRLLVQRGLARCGDRDVDALALHVEREGDLATFAVLAARVGMLAEAGAAVDALVAQGAYPATPGELRAGCAWAVARHDPVRGGVLAGTLLADDEGAFWLASVVARRGGPLREAVAGIHARPELDRVGALLGIEG